MYSAPPAERIEQARPNRLLKRVCGKEMLLSKMENRLMERTYRSNEMYGSTGPQDGCMLRPMPTVLSPIESEFATAEEAQAHDRWFRAEVEAALREADAPRVVFVPHDEVMADMEAIIHEAELRLAAKRS